MFAFLLLCACVTIVVAKKKQKTEWPTNVPEKTKDCVDEWSKSYCKRLKKDDRCYETKVSWRCSKTCDKCGPVEKCEDKRPQSWCKKRLQDCQQKFDKMNERCPETCGFCPENICKDTHAIFEPLGRLGYTAEEECRAWKDQGQCENENVAQVCRATCQKCE